MPFVLDVHSQFRYSLWKFIKSWLEDTDIWGTAWDVYLEAQLKNPSFVPPSGTNHIYLLDSQVLVRMKDLPAVIVETMEHNAFGFQTGDQYTAYEGIFNIHFLGRSRTERELLSGQWTDTVREIPLIDQLTGGTPVSRQGGDLIGKLLPIGPGERIWAASYFREPNEKKLFEGSVTNWTIVSGRIIII